jgi:hypothetical protein
MPAAAIETFIARWQGVTASELASAQSFVIDLCHLLDVEKPHPTPEQNYMFERPVTFRWGDGDSSAGRIDCYRRGAFVLEAKKLKKSAVATRHTRDLTTRFCAHGAKPRATPALCRPRRAGRLS